MEKYKIRTDLTKVVGGVKLHRIEALVDFANVDRGELGGYVQAAQNLSQGDNSWIYDDAKVYGDARVCGRAELSRDAKVCAVTDYVVFKNIWSSGRYFTYTRSNKMWKVGCFYGTGEELVEKARKDGDVSAREYARVVKYVEEMYAGLEKDNKESNQN